MTPQPRRVDWPLVAFWTALLLAGMAFACVIVSGLLYLAQRIIMALWPWVQANSDGLALGLGLSVAIATVAALCFEAERQ